MRSDKDSDSSSQTTPGSQHEAGVSGEEVDFEIVPEDEASRHEKRAAELFDMLQRTQADFENYRKRAESRYAEVVKYASERLLLRLLDVYDNLSRALEFDFSKDPKAARDGIAAIHLQIQKILEEEEVVPIESVGKPFDPYYQHSVGRVNDPTQADGIVISEYVKGYLFKERVLRPALVVVNRHEQPSTSTESTVNRDHEQVSEGDQHD